MKEFPAATDGLKYRLQRARQEVPKLPGIRMTIEEQEQEIKEWEDRIVRQKEELEKAKALARRLLGEVATEKTDVVMGGTAS